MQKNIYIDTILHEKSILIAENIFLESTLDSPWGNGVLCAKNILSIGKKFGIIPFFKSKDDLLSSSENIVFSIYEDRDSISRFSLSDFDIFSKHKGKFYLSAETYLNGCDKAGISLDSSMAYLCYKTMTETIENWIELSGAFSFRFWYNP